MISRTAKIPILLLWPSGGFPIFFALSITYDTVSGDRLLLFVLRHGSRSQLLHTTLADWLHALPISYALAGATGLLVYGWIRYVNRYSRAFFTGLSALGCGLIAYLATGHLSPLGPIAALTGVLWAISLCVVMAWINKPEQ